MPNFQLDVAQSSNTPIPLVQTDWFSFVQIQAQKGRIDLAMANAQHVHVDNRLSRDIIVQFTTAAQSQALTYIVDPGTDTTFNFPFALYGCTIFDTFAYSPQPFPIVGGMEEGTRGFDRLPFGAQTILGGATAPPYGGGVLITQCSQPINMERGTRTVVKKSNWAATLGPAVGAGQLTLSSNGIANIANVRASGYFNYLLVNPLATSMSVVCTPPGGNFSAANGTTIQVLANTPLSIPIEAEFLTVNFTAAGQLVTALAEVVMAANTTEP